jgi:zinc transport system permease protein
MIEALTGWWSYSFMRNAFFAILLIMPLFSMLGTAVVSSGMSFFSDALGHSALTGVGIGLLLGLREYNAVMVVFAVLFALLMNRIRRARLASSDTVIGVFSACGTALGIVLLSRLGGMQGFQALIIGDILGITAADLWVLAGALAMTGVAWLLLYNPLQAVNVSPAVARSQGMPVALIDNLFVVIVAVTVMLAIRWVGLLIINAMLVLPAAAARSLARDLRSYQVLALVFGLFAGIFGLLLSYWSGAETGPMIVLTAGALYFGAFLLRKK